MMGMLEGGGTLNVSLACLTVIYTNFTSRWGQCQCIYMYVCVYVCVCVWGVWGLRLLRLLGV